MTALYPLRFEPRFRRYLWGGRRLGELLDKPIGPETDYAESWEVVDHADDQSVVANGPLAGVSLGQLMAERAGDVIGPSVAAELQVRQFGGSNARPRFPLLWKFLDAHSNLSVQVHPTDEAAAQLSPPDLGKTEAWVVLHADPGSVLYAGLKRGFDRPALEREVHRGTTALCLHQIEPRVGDCLFIPAGTIHALGAGLVVAEIQQASDTTYRLFDWNRTGPDGKPRKLHIREALDTIDFQRGPVSPQTPQSTDRPHVERLVACPYFRLDRWRIDGTEPLAPQDVCRIVAVIRGEVRLSGDPSGEPLRRGQVALVPASVEDTELQASGPTELLVGSV